MSYYKEAIHAEIRTLIRAIDRIEQDEQRGAFSETELTLRVGRRLGYQVSKAALLRILDDAPYFEERPIRDYYRAELRRLAEQIRKDNIIIAQELWNIIAAQPDK